MADAKLISRENNIARIRISLDSEDVAQQYRQIYREYGKELKLPGFRKGKIPVNVIRQRLGQENIDAAAADVLKDFALRQALASLELDARAGDTVWHEEPEVSEGQGAEYEFSHPVLPEITLPDYTQFELKVPALQITDGMKDRYKNRLRERFTKFPDKEGPAGEGEALKFSFSSKYADDGTDAPFSHPEMLLIVGREGNLPGWDEQLSGKSAGETMEFEYLMPEDFADQRVANRKLNVSLEVKSVHTVEEPELSLEFVKEHLRLESLEEFDDYIMQSLNHERNQQVQQIRQELAMQKLIEGMQAEISEDMVNTELDGMVKDNDNQLRQYGSSLDAYLKDKDQTLQEFREERRESAERKIKLFLAVKQIAEEQKLGATSEDFQRYALMMMQQEGIPPEQFKELLKHQEFINEASFQIIKEKALRHVADSAKFEEEQVSVGDDVKTPAPDTAEEAVDADDGDSSDADAAAESE